jgi:hypothetical protein
VKRVQLATVRLSAAVFIIKEFLTGWMRRSNRNVKPQSCKLLAQYLIIHSFSGYRKLFSEDGER